MKKIWKSISDFFKKVYKGFIGIFSITPYTNKPIVADGDDTEDDSGGVIPPTGGGSTIPLPPTPPTKSASLEDSGKIEVVVGIETEVKVPVKRKPRVTKKVTKPSDAN